MTVILLLHVYLTQESNSSTTVEVEMITKIQNTITNVSVHCRRCSLSAL